MTLSLARAAARAYIRDKRRKEREQLEAEERAKIRAEEMARLRDADRARRQEAWHKERKQAQEALLQARKAREDAERAAREIEAARLVEKFKPVPDHRMIALHGDIASLGLPADVVTQFKRLPTGAKFALVESLGEHIKEALPLYFAIEPGARAMALRWAKAGDPVLRLRACLPLS